MGTGDGFGFNFLEKTQLKSPFLFQAAGSAALFVIFRLHAGQGLLLVDSMWVYSFTWMFAPSFVVWLLPPSGGGGVGWSL